jgi:hypothetical protein
MTTSIFRIRFVEWQSFAKDICAATPEEAIELAQCIRNERGTLEFDEMDGGTEGWDAEAIPSSEDVHADLRKVASLALRALNTAKRFKVDNTDSYTIAAKLSDCLDAVAGAKR